MKKEELISIIIPIYNAQKYLSKCIESILKQSYKNIEIILINDGSTDNSLQICYKYENIDNRVKVFHTENSGVSSARNLGIREANGEWISFIDADDYIDIIFVEKMVEYINDEIDIISCCCYVFNNMKEDINHFFSKDMIIIQEYDKNSLYLQLMDKDYGQKNLKHSYTAIGVPWAKLYRRSFINENNLRFNPILIRMQDNIFNMYAIKFARKIIYIDKPLYYYRLDHIEKYTKRKFSPEYAENLIKVLYERKKFLNKYNLELECEIQEKFNWEIITRLNQIMRFYTFHKDCKINIKNKIKCIKLLCDKDIFKVAIENSSFNSMKRIKEKFFLLMLKMKMYRVICLYMEHKE